MSVEDELVKEFKRDDRRRVEQIPADQDARKAYRQAVASLMGDRMAVRELVAPHVAEADVDPVPLSTGVVVRLEDAVTDETLDVLVVGEPGRLEAYVLGECWACENRTALDPVLDPENGRYTAGLAFAVNAPAAVHRCRQQRR